MIKDSDILMVLGGQKDVEKIEGKSNLKNGKRANDNLCPAYIGNQNLT